MSSVSKIFRLNEYQILMATKYLNNEDRIKLLDIFPSIVNQIITYNPGFQIITKLQELWVMPLSDLDQFRKLTAVRQVILHGQPGETYERFREEQELFYIAILDGRNESMVSFSSKKLLPPNIVGFVIYYIKNVLEKNPEYDARCIKHVFMYDYVKELIGENPNLKLNLQLFIEPDNCAEIVQLNNEIKSMVTWLVLDNEEKFHINDFFVRNSDDSSIAVDDSDSESDFLEAVEDRACDADRTDSNDVNLMATIVNLMATMTNPIVTRKD